MKTLITVIALLAICALCGCSTINDKVIELDKDFAKLLNYESETPPACATGFTMGYLYMEEKSQKLQLALQALGMTVDTTDPEYIRCYNKGLRIAVAKLMIKGNIDAAITKATTLGLIK